MYYLLLEGAQAGPFSLAQLTDLWRAHRVDVLTLYWEEGNADWLPLHNIAPLLESPERPASAPAQPVPPSIPTAGPPPDADDEVLWTRHPTFWHWTGELIWGVLLTPVLVGIPILVHVFCARQATRYRVTRSRVSVEAGVFTRSSRELRIADIRSIAASANLFGIGDVEFSTAARVEAEVAFRSLAGVEQVRDLVKQLQNESGETTR